MLRGICKRMEISGERGGLRAEDEDGGSSVVSTAGLKPGVYHLAVRPEADDSLFPIEYYLVLDSAP